MLVEHFYDNGAPSYLAFDGPVEFNRMAWMPEEWKID